MRTRRVVPPEMIHAVLKFSDRTTLAACALVSFSILAMVAPLLYDSVEIHSAAQLCLLFGFRTVRPEFRDANGLHVLIQRFLLSQNKALPRDKDITALLCPSQISKLSLKHLSIFNHSVVDLLAAVHLPSLPSGILPLKISRLDLVLWPSNSLSRYGQEPSEFAVQAVLRLVDPRELVLDGWGLQRGRALSRLQACPWPRLRAIRLTRSLIHGWPTDMAGVRHATGADPFIITLDCVPFGYESVPGEAFLSYLFTDFFQAVGCHSDRLLNGFLVFRALFATEPGAQDALAHFKFHSVDYHSDAAKNTTAAFPPLDERFALASPIVQAGLHFFVGGERYRF